MAVDLSEYVDSLRRAVTPLGANTYAGVSDQVLADHLLDAFWNARLDGFMKQYAASEDGVVEPVSEGAPDLDRSWISLIALYASIEILTKQVMNTQTKMRAKGGPVEFEQENSATMLAEMLRQLAATKKRILDDLLDSAQGATPVFLSDAYSTRALCSVSYYGGPSLIG